MTNRVVPCALIAALFLLALMGCTSQPEQMQQQTLENFSKQKLSEYDGQVVLLHFWAIWCLPCRQEMPALEAVYQEYREQGVVVVAVNVSEDPEDILTFAREHQLSFPIFADQQQEAIKAYNIRLLPTTLFIDRQGHVRHQNSGAMTKEFMTEQIESLLEHAARSNSSAGHIMPPDNQG